MQLARNWGEIEEEKRGKKKLIRLLVSQLRERRGSPRRAELLPPEYEVVVLSRAWLRRSNSCLFVKLANCFTRPTCSSHVPTYELNQSQTSQLYILVKEPWTHEQPTFQKWGKRTLQPSTRLAWMPCHGLQTATSIVYSHKPILRELLPVETLNNNITTSTTQKLLKTSWTTRTTQELVQHKYTTTVTSWMSKVQLDCIIPSNNKITTVDNYWTTTATRQQLLNPNYCLHILEF